MIEEHKNKIFWFFFIIAGVLIAFTGFGFIFAEIVMGLLIIVIGVLKLIEETNQKRDDKEKERVRENLDYITSWLNENHTHTEKLKTKYDMRFFNSNKKKQEMGKKMEKNHRDVVRKVLDMENKFNQLIQTYTRGEKIRSGRKKK
jgi:hypothetical protein